MFNQFPGIDFVLLTFVVVDVPFGEPASTEISPEEEIEEGVNSLFVDLSTFSGNIKYIFTKFTVPFITHSILSYLEMYSF